MNTEDRTGNEVANEILRLLRRISELEAAEIERQAALSEQLPPLRHDSSSVRRAGVHDHGALCDLGCLKGSCCIWPRSCLDKGTFPTRGCCN